MTNSKPSIEYLEIPDKSESDKKDYKCMILPNGLKVLLVSDTYNKTGSNCNAIDDSLSLQSTNAKANDKLSAVALMVDVGAFEQPRDFQGLAHFLEHMIFMGSKKFPQENAFDKHITKFGGYNNARTDIEDTVYFFEVPEKHLDSSMEYLAAQLEEPLLIQESMTREREAIESEFQLAFNNDESRRFQLIQRFSNESYPYDNFIWGNLKSLKEDIESDQELHKELQKFYKRHYSAHRIFACIHSCLTLEELEDLAIKHFADIKNNQLSGLDFSQYNHQQAFKKEFYENVLFVKSIENVYKLDLTWVLPCTLKMYKCKPLDFLSHVLGYEGKGSLCAYLRKRLWALLVMAHEETNPIFSLFRLSITLTDLGLKKLEKVLEATFSYIKLFNNASELKQFYEELSTIKATNFRYTPEISPADHVQLLVGCMKHLPSKDTLTGFQIYFNFNEDEIQILLDHLNVFHFNIMLTTQHDYENVEYDQREKWFGTEYASKIMPEKWSKIWHNCQIMPELYLPPANPFIAHDFRIFCFENGRQKLTESPEKLLQTEKFELWFKQDDTFHLPHGFMYFYVITPLVRKSGKNSVLCSLYLELVEHHLVEELYPATEAGITYEIYGAEKGIVITVGGYNEKLYLVIELLLKALITTKDRIDENQLEIFKKQFQKNFFNALIKPEVINMDIEAYILKPKHWLLTERNNCISDISLSELQAFAEELIQEIYVQALIQGNFQQETALQVMRTVMDHLNGGSIKEKSIIEDRTSKIPLGNHKIMCRNLNPKDCNSVTTHFYQIGPCSLRDECILSLLLMILQTPLYDTLRTKQQLGYSVNCSKQINYGIKGYSISVSSQETKHSACHVEQCIDSFHQDIKRILNEISLENFENFKNSLIKLKEIKDVALSEEVSRNWSEIVNDEYLFERRFKEIDILKTVEKQDVLEFWHKNYTENLRNLTTQVVGFNTTATTKEDINEVSNADMELTFLSDDTDKSIITNLTEFKDNLYVYPVTKTEV